MKLTINIGLNTPDGVISVLSALQALAKENISVMRHDVFVSATEPTLVASVILPSTPDTRHAASGGDDSALYRVAQALKQECIAVWSPDLHTGTLIGPDAAKWSPFNPEFFLTLDGERLSAQTDVIRASLCRRM